MTQKREVLVAFCVTLFILSMTATGIAMAKPDPSEGDMQQSQLQQDWNWNVNATVKGHWVWAYPHYYHFEEETFYGDRWCGNGIYAWEYLTIQYGFDGSNSTDQVYQPAVHVQDTLGEECNHIYCQATAGFITWFGQIFYKTTDWAEVSI